MQTLLPLAHDPVKRPDSTPAAEIKSGRAIPGLPGWYESPVRPRLSVLAHESGAGPVYVREVGWGRPRPFVLVETEERRFGTIAEACRFAIEQEEARVSKLTEAECENEADHFARTADVILIGDEVLTRGEARKRLAHPDTGGEFEPEEDPTDFPPPDEGGGEEESTYSTDDRRSGLCFPETPW